MKVASESPSRRRKRDPEKTRASLVQAAIALILRQGFAATSVGEICQHAGSTKGSFFHHFESKEAIGCAAIEEWGRFGTALYAEAWNDPGSEPLQQLGRFFEIMEGFTRRKDEVCTCVVGIMSQETAQSNDELRDRAARELLCWTENVSQMIASAKKRHCPQASFDPDSLAWHLNALWQGSMLIGKTRRTPELIRSNLHHAREWLAGFFPSKVRQLLLSPIETSKTKPIKKTNK